MRFYFTVFFVVFIYLAGCSPVDKLQKYKEGESACTATLEGHLFETDKWIGDAPLLVERSVGRNFEYRKGRILELSEEGVMFDEDRRSMANNPEPEFYKYDDLHSLIDSTGTVIQGEYPDSRLRTDYYEFYLSEIGSGNDPVMFRIEPDKPFRYCIDSGEYGLQTVVWRRQDGTSDISSPFYMPGHSIVVEKGMANYIGNIYVNHSEQHEFANHYKFHMEAHERPNSGFYIYGQGSNALFLGIASTIFSELMRERGIVSVLDVQIVDDLGYESTTGYPVRFTELY
ncbi:hypothetical protein [Rhodohalobacter sp. 8-1]|uniref:hypothetical protein n=1 Tax=Rhodohalobacter sp. 8-1 TaxID=3131972 RepID=UPI0030ECD42B